MASITQRGPHSFRVLIRRAGEKPVCKTFRTRAEAEAFARQGGRHDTPVTVNDAIVAYERLRAEGRRPVGRKTNEAYMLAHLSRDLGSERVDRLTVEKLRLWAAARASDGAGGYTINMELSKLSTVLRYASVALGQQLPDVARDARPLLTHLNLIGPSSSRDRRLEDGEEERLLALAPRWLADVVRFALETAMRRGEIVRLRWADVDHKRRLVMVRDRKHPRRKLGNHEWIPLLGTSYHIVRAQKQEGDRIFPFSPEQVSDSFKLLCDAAGIEDLHFHDLRHEGTSRLFEQGYTVEQVALVTGHRDWRNLRRYTQLRPEFLHDLAPRPDAQLRQRSAPRAGRAPAKSAPGKSRR